MNLNHKKIKVLQISVFFLILLGLANISVAQTNKSGEKTQESKPLNITEQPKPKIPENFGTRDEQGVIRFRVEFLANGQIGKIIPITIISADLTEYAFEVVKKIKFEPAIKNNEPITIVKMVEYFYSWDGGWKISSQKIQTKSDEKAEAILKKAIEKIGGEKYLGVKSQIGRGKFSQLRDGQIVSFQTFIDVIVFPDNERTEFKNGGTKTVQTNVGNGGWIFDGAAQTINDQTEQQIKNFKNGIRTSLDNLLRGGWRKEGAKLEYVGKRQSGLGKRSDVIKLTFDADFVVEFEFSDDGFPMKSIYKRLNVDGEEITEEDRYAQFIEISGIKTPFIIDHFSDKTHISRINYESIEFNKSVSDSIFTKPSNLKDFKKDLKL